MPRTFEHTITILIRTTEHNPDMPTLNVNYLANHLRDEAVSVLATDYTMVEAQVTEARRTS